MSTELHPNSNPPPEPETEVNHDDWVAGVAARGRFVLTACYDNTISIFRSVFRL